MFDLQIISNRTPRRDILDTMSVTKKVVSVYFTLSLIPPGVWSSVYKVLSLLCIKIKITSCGVNGLDHWTRVGLYFPGFYIKKVHGSSTSRPRRSTRRV